MVAPVKGKVTLNGKALPPGQGRITYYPEDGRAATSALEADGSYTLTTFTPHDGALVGKHRVSIKVTRIIGAGAAPKTLEEEIALSKIENRNPAEAVLVWIVPERFADQNKSELIAIVEPQPNTIDFDLKSE